MPMLTPELYFLLHFDIFASFFEMLFDVAFSREL